MSDGKQLTGHAHFLIVLVDVLKSVAWKLMGKSQKWMVLME